jgi:hypothetical protein
MNLLTFVRAMCLEVLDCGLRLLEFFVREHGGGKVNIGKVKGKRCLPTINVAR